ncbi:MAG: GNAT family N-acetyltransferase [Proteobacteria bacterium]|nr:GNAT family N-acetyltransferase [Pseudomonadota bacterium]
MTSIDQVDQAAWDALDHGPSPFLRHGFLRALEITGSIGSESGWNPAYILAETAPGKKLSQSSSGDKDSPSLVGAIAAFVKTHSYGEYIFDWSWANASQRAGISYYPKLVIAAPMTPATGRRILLADRTTLASMAPTIDPEHVTIALVAGITDVADQSDCSSIHWLFCMEDEAETLAAMGFSRRLTHQYHWYNQGYRDYGEFLDRLTSRKRKQMRKERRRAVEQLDGPIEFVPGPELTDEQLSCMDRYYRSTVFAHGGMDYLRRRFFHTLAETCPEPMLFAQARRSGRIVAGAFFMESDRGLYGRYWGCDRDIEFLHFETAYYAAIERCIERGIARFEAGAQGEHKLLRGFAPAHTHSCHWLRHPGLRAAIGQYLDDERREVARRIERLSTYGPYKRPPGCNSAI